MVSMATRAGFYYLFPFIRLTLFFLLKQEMQMMVHWWYRNSNIYNIFSFLAAKMLKNV